MRRSRSIMGRKRKEEEPRPKGNKNSRSGVSRSLAKSKAKSNRSSMGPTPADPKYVSGREVMHTVATGEKMTGGQKVATANAMAGKSTKQTKIPMANKPKSSLTSAQMAEIKANVKGAPKGRIGSAYRAAEYKARGWAMDDTIKGNPKSAKKTKKPKAGQSIKQMSNEISSYLDNRKIPSYKDGGMVKDTKKYGREVHSNTCGGMGSSDIGYACGGKVHKKGK